MQRISGHEVNECNEAIMITADDRDPSNGNASHVYRLNFAPQPAGLPQPMDLVVRFQNGPIKVAGINGVTNEALLAILIDRMEGFQSGPYACAENATALDCLRAAQAALHSRTRERFERGVEGTHEV